MAIEDITNATSVDNGISNGTGVLDKMMNTIVLYLEDQYQRKRLLGTDYANVLLGAIQAVTTESVQYFLKEKEMIKNNEVKDAQIALYNRQREGFDDNKYQKLFEAQMNSWALMYSSGLLNDKPSIISNDSVSELYNVLKP